MVEKRYRSVIKTISWRVTATVTTMVIAYVITGKLTIAIEIGSIEVIAKLLLGYLHERGWDHINFGRAEYRDYQI